MLSMTDALLALASVVYLAATVDAGYYEWHLTVGQAAPDCFLRDVILVNGEFQPTLNVTQGDLLQVFTSEVHHTCSPASAASNAGTCKP